MNVSDIDKRFETKDKKDKDKTVLLDEVTISKKEWLEVRDLLNQLAYPDYSKIRSSIGPLHAAGIHAGTEDVARFVQQQTGLPARK